MKKIYIPYLLQVPQKTQTIILDDFITELITLTPFRGLITIRHGGTFLEINLKGETIINLTCDRCLQQYNHRIKLKVFENIWLSKSWNSDQKFIQEKDLILEDFSETLPSEGYFNSKIWIYEQLSLSVPLRKLCSNNCQTPVILDQEISTSVNNCWKGLENFQKN